MKRVSAAILLCTGLLVSSLQSGCGRDPDRRPWLAHVRIAVTPTHPAIALGTTRTFQATGTFSDGTTQDLSASVSWNSSNPEVASVDDAGIAAGLDVGSAAIVATDPDSGVSDSTTLTVTAAVLLSIEITPTNPSIALGTTQPFAATGTFSDGTTQDLSPSVLWSSSDTGIATLGTDGLASGVGVGTVSVLATDPATSLSGSTALTVTDAVLLSIEVAPTSPSNALGTTRQFTATGTYSDGSTQDLTSSATWASSNTSKATISNAVGSRGLATSVAVGSTTISATDPASSISGSTTLTITAAVLVSIDVTPAGPSIALGTTQQFTATGTYSDGSTQDLTSSATWASSNTSKATISNAVGSRGLATSVAVGSTTISATDPASSISGSTTLTVTAAVLVSIDVTPASPSIALGTTQQFTATGTYSDGSTQDLTSTATWSSSNTSQATISNAVGAQGLATGVAAGSTTVTATDAGTAISGSTTLTVLPDVQLVNADSSAAASGVLTLTINTPAGTAAGDELIAAIAVRPNTATITPPASGWTLVRRIDNAAGAAHSLAIYRRVAVAGEPGSHSWGFSSSTGSAGGIASFANVDTSQPIDVENGQTTASGLTHSSPSITTSVGRTMLVTSHAFSSAATWTPPAGMSEACDIASETVPSATGISLELNCVLLTGAGASGAKSAVASANADVGNAHALALRQAP